VPEDAINPRGNWCGVIILSDNEEELGLREGFIREMKKAKEEDTRGEGVSLEEVAKK